MVLLTFIATFMLSTQAIQQRNKNDIVFRGSKVVFTSVNYRGAQRILQGEKGVGKAKGCSPWKEEETSFICSATTKA